MTVTGQVYKVIVYHYVDALVETVGREAAKAVLRHARLPNLLSSPSLNVDETVSLESFKRLKVSSMKLFGRSYGAVVRRAGYLTALSTPFPKAVGSTVRFASFFGGWRSILMLAVKSFFKPTGAKPELRTAVNGCLLKIHECPECKDAECQSPCCYFMCGFVSGVLERLCEVRAEVVEASCAASGDECCEFLITLV